MIQNFHGGYRLAEITKFIDISIYFYSQKNISFYYFNLVQKKKKT